MHRVIAQKADQHGDRELATKASPVAEPKPDRVPVQPRIEPAVCLRNKGLLAVWPHKALRLESFWVLPIARAIVCMSKRDQGCAVELDGVLTDSRGVNEDDGSLLYDQLPLGRRDKWLPPASSRVRHWTIELGGAIQDA